MDDRTVTLQWQGTTLTCAPSQIRPYEIFNSEMLDEDSTPLRQMEDMITWLEDKDQGWHYFKDGESLVNIKNNATFYPELVIPN